MNVSPARVRYVLADTTAVRQKILLPYYRVENFTLIAAVAAPSLPLATKVKIKSF